MKATPASKLHLDRAVRLHERKQREKFQQTLVEGPQAVRELLVHQPRLVRDVYFTKATLISHPELRTLVEKTDVYHHPVNADEIRELSQDARGIVAVINIPQPPRKASVLEGANLVIATANVQDPGNVGSIIRVADAAGADGVLLGKGSAELWAPKVIRSTAGSIFHLPVCDNVNVGKIDADMERFGLQYLAADAGGDWDFATLVDSANEETYLGVPGEGPNLTEPTCWIVGNEAHGFDDVDISVDAVVSIPIYGKAESYNVATAASLLLTTTAMLQRKKHAGN